jgi:peptidoglycan/LPS O-acetylase OafA/YrhL
MPARPRSHAEYSTRAYAPQLDGRRALAVLLVIACHIQGQAFAALAGRAAVHPARATVVGAIDAVGEVRLA